MHQNASHPSDHQTDEHETAEPEGGSMVQQDPKGLVPEQIEKSRTNQNQEEREQDRSHGMNLGPFQELALGQIGKAGGEATAGAGHMGEPQEKTGRKVKVLMSAVAAGVGA